MNSQRTKDLTFIPVRESVRLFCAAHGFRRVYEGEPLTT